MAESTSPEPVSPAPPPIAGISKQPDEDMLEPGESILTVVHRSLIGLVGIYLVAILAIGAIFTLIIALASGSSSSSGDTISTQLGAIIVVGAVLLVLLLFTATYVYRQSRLLVTDKSLVQVMQKTLFIRKVSRLSMSNVEDVNEEQRGILASIFGYGTLTVQTAGTQDNFVFTLCPSPARLADRIIEARQGN